jgi:ribonuclease P protein component
VNLDVRIAASPLGIPRVGIVVPRHQHSAVDRNRLKRRLRELVRTGLLPALRARDAATDIAIRARREAYDVELEALAHDVRTITNVTAGSAANETQGR